jgi:predicted nucleotidyltransferase
MEADQLTESTDIGEVDLRCYYRVVSKEVDYPEVQRIFRESRVRLAWLFGSRCRREDSANSDIDFAVLLPDNVAPIQRVEIGGMLSRRLERVLGAPVDLVVLNDAGSLLRYEAAARGQLVFGDFDEAFAFERCVRAAYEDLQHIQGFFISAMKDRLAVSG